MDSYNNHHHHHRHHPIMDSNYDNIVYSNAQQAPPPPQPQTDSVIHHPIHSNEMSSESIVLDNDADKNLECNNDRNIATFPQSTESTHEMLQQQQQQHNIQHDIHNEQVLIDQQQQQEQQQQQISTITTSNPDDDMQIQETEYCENSKESTMAPQATKNKENLIKAEVDGQIKTTSLKIEPINEDSEMAGGSNELLIKKEATELDQNQCRICLTKNDLTNIFGYENDQRICDTIMIICSVKISERDFLPHYVCAVCLEKIKISITFKNDCENTDKELRAKLKRSKKTYRREKPRDFVMVDCELSSGEDKDPKDDDEFHLSEVPESEPDSDASFEVNKKKKVTKKKSTPPKRKSESSRSKRDSTIRSSSKSASAAARTTRNSSRISTPSNNTPSKRFKHDVVFVEAPHLSESDGNVSDDSTANKQQNKKILRGPRGPYKKKPQSVSEEKKSSPAAAAVAVVKPSSKAVNSKIPHKKRAIKTNDTDNDDDDLVSNRSTSTTNSKTPSSATKTQYPCDICNKVFDSKTSRGEHSKIHIGEKPLSCYICQKGFKHKTPLESHIQKHKDDESRTCKICDRMFGSRMELRKHQQTVHQDIYTFECETCKRTFATKQRFDKHVESSCPGYDTTVVKKKPDETTPTFGRDLFKSVAPTTTTYWSDSFSE